MAGAADYHLLPLLLRETLSICISSGMLVGRVSSFQNNESSAAGVYPKGKCIAVVLAQLLPRMLLSFSSSLQSMLLSPSIAMH